jgi:hypothetical protein
MPRHEFRTIEEFVKLLDDEASNNRRISKSNGVDIRDKDEAAGGAIAYAAIAKLVRTSNLGIVYPPGGDGIDKP